LVSHEKVPGEEAAVLPVVDEQASITKRQTNAGQVQVDLSTETVERDLEADLAFEEIEIERIPCERLIDSVPEIHTEGDTTIIPVVEERAVVHRQLVLVEEVRLTRKRRERTVTLPVQLRQQRAHVRRNESGSPDNPETAKAKET
jgi:uncharacterized protein (TIGR02271 family)